VVSVVGEAKMVRHQYAKYAARMAGKWLEMLTQLNPPVARVAVLHNPATAP
jgi:putative ABC transport system substrate-binding protein